MRRERGPSRVLMTADAVGGIWHYAMELARGLCRRGVRVRLCAMGPAPSAAQEALAAAVGGLELVHRPYRLEWMPDAETDLWRAADWISAQAEAFRPDIVHLNGYALACLPWHCPVVVVAHSCVRSWWRAVRRSEPPAEWDGYLARVAEGLSAADLVVAPTTAFLAAIERLYGPLARGIVIRNGRSAGFGPATAKQSFVLACGRLWDEGKGADVLTRIAPTLDWRLCLAGDTRAPEGRQRAFSGVRLLGLLDPPEMAAWMAAAAVFAAPARYEPFGLAVLEAALSRCALVLSDIPSFRELWEGAALFVDPANEADLTATLNRLAADAALCASLGARALTRARGYDADSMVERYLAAYRRLLARPAWLAADAGTAAPPPARRATR